uniref:Kelch-like protein 17 n=1 Tax=Rhizophagus irregularis (strain DAOM 181602 / DAOM 197198 / MUCL 43194) TaxID=747089 RepID=U9SHT9_RHIID
MVILNYRSPYLRRILSTNVNKNKNDGVLTHIKLPNILPETFQMILRYIYGGRLSLEEYDTSDIIKILIASSELSLQELIINLQSFLIEYKKDWMEQNFNLIYKTSFENDSFLKLQNFCTELISNEPEKIFNSIDFISLSEKSLISLIQHDNFQMNVIQVWEHVLKWGIAQNPGLPSDPSSYSKEDFITLRGTLQQCIPFIEFFDLNHNEFLEKVYPYKKILPKDLRENLIKHFVNQSSDNPEPMMTKEVGSKGIDSEIITIQHAELISKWIDKLDITEEIKNPYEFNLILRGSRDGFSPSKFHEICDNKFHTISIIKVKDSNEILGGYNPIIWKSDYSDSVTKDSFIFSFKNKENINGYILSRVKNKKYAIDNSAYSGPSFGVGDLKLYGDNCYDESSCCNFDYEKPIRDTKNRFSVEEKNVDPYTYFQLGRLIGREGCNLKPIAEKTGTYIHVITDTKPAHFEI